MLGASIALLVRMLFHTFMDACSHSFSALSLYARTALFECVGSSYKPFAKHPLAHCRRRLLPLIFKCVYRRPRGTAGEDHGPAKPTKEPPMKAGKGETTPMEGLPVEGAAAPIAVAPVATGIPTHIDVEGASTPVSVPPVKPPKIVEEEEEEDDHVPGEKYPAPVAAPVKASY
jgi:hypothetical protein